MAKSARFRFLAVAVVFHVVYFFSIFDIYFVSPIVSGMQLFGVERLPATKAPADRLVLFVGDGLRADKAFQAHPEPYPKTDDDLTPRHLAPFLRSRALEHGTFGVSHTRVPTESRPGHVALIAGLYEDVSAVTTGWKMNPVDFDSVFNRSRHTWSWGSPDILDMFEHGSVPGRVDAYTYGHEEEDFSRDSTALDFWVFDHVKELFAEARTNPTLDAALREDKIVFFLHLLGLDTAGHSYRPYSKEYLYNIKIVDEGVKELTKMIDQFYADDRTAYVFTADHGMSDWGSHGDGHPNNTRTPLITWGSGVAKPQFSADDKIAPGHDELSSDWGLDHVRRHDVSQADVAALMAYLVGVDFPANSVGELPLSYLAAPIEDKAEAALVNAQGILEMYRVKEEGKMETELQYRPYSPFSGEHTPQNRVAAIRALIAAGKHEEAIEESATLIKLGLEGLRYLQTYDWLFLRVLITVGFFGWMAFALTAVLDLHVLQGSTETVRSMGGMVFFSSVLIGLYASFVVSRSPGSYYAYAFFPVFFWEEVWVRRGCWRDGRRALFGHVTSGARVLTLVLNMGGYVGVIISLALGYIHREVLTVLYILGAFWPVMEGFTFVRDHIWLCLTWLVSCLCMSVFTLLPAMKVEDVDLIMIGGGLMVFVGYLFLVFENYVLADFSSPSPKRESSVTSSVVSRCIMGAQIGFILLSMWVTRSSALSLQAKLGLPRGNQIVGWAVLVLPFFMPLLYRLQPNDHYLHRLMVVFLTCAPSFVIFTISYEGLFYVAFSITLVTWVRLETQVDLVASAKLKARKETNGSVGEVDVDKKEDISTPATRAAAVDATVKESQQAQANGNGKEENAEDTPPTYRPLRLSDARTALFFMVLLQSAFFSTGNVASVSSFSLDAVYRLIPIFDPFSQGALLLFKLMIPFFLISANLGTLNGRLGVAPSGFFMAIMALSDGLTLYFFWVVRDEGSWLEIGSTISHFAIASLLCAFLPVLEGVSCLFTGGVGRAGGGLGGGKGDRKGKVGGEGVMKREEGKVIYGEEKEKIVIE